MNAKEREEVNWELNPTEPAKPRDVREELVFLIAEIGYVSILGMITVNIMVTNRNA